MGNNRRLLRKCKNSLGFVARLPEVFYMDEAFCAENNTNGVKKYQKTLEKSAQLRYNRKSGDDEKALLF